MGHCTKTSCISGRMQLFKKMPLHLDFFIVQSSVVICNHLPVKHCDGEVDIKILIDVQLQHGLQSIFEGDQIVSHPQPYHTVNNVIIIFQTFAPQLPYSAPQNPQNVPCS